MHQNIQLIRTKVRRLKNFASTSPALVPQFVNFSCFQFSFVVAKGPFPKIKTVQVFKIGCGVLDKLRNQYRYLKRDDLQSARRSIDCVIVISYGRTACERRLTDGYWLTYCYAYSVCFVLCKPCQASSCSTGFEMLAIVSQNTQQRRVVTSTGQYL